ncbi:T9SS type B sorting domain-containing protein [Winogradskyella helgolandensis]|uniref:T9SS type B sorting domain-containing protein n=1 Tax=Winogradskyella helgolandensis TaxID=2697010 RepID=UPI0015CA74DA|nr:T9SS type B sorting domain-containing protein [Winogradskyella helgolandensis]
MKRINLLIHCTYVLSLFFITNTYATVSSDIEEDNSFCPAPIINTFTPATGPQNTLITINGSNFSAAASVSVDGINTTFTIINDSQITALIPAGAIDTSGISIISNGGCTGTSSSDFTVLATNCDSADIYISELYDANGGDYAVIELYNPTNSPVIIDNVYVIERFGDVGNATPNNIFNTIIGTIPPMDTFVIQMGSGTNCSPLDVDFNIPTGINDNDEFKLYKNGTLIDIVNAPDEKGYTVIRNADAPLPQTTYDSNDWTINSSENCSNLGSHTADPITNNIPEIIDPITQTICENGAVTFITSLNNSIFQYQWKVLDASGNWVDVPNASPYSDPQNSWLDITNAPLSFDGNQYYCEVIYNSCPLITNVAQLIIDNPAVDTLSDQTVCSSYTLPILTDGDYYTVTDGAGTQLNAGDIISTDQTIYIYNEIGTAPDNCSNESSFDITITGTPDIDTITNQTVCSSYTLPALTNGDYYTATDGGGTQLNAGDIISTDQTIYIYNEIGTAPDNCSNESSFVIAITGTPDVDTITNQTVCSSYTLPALTNGDYYTATDGTGTQLNAGDIISTDQTIYIYNEIGTAPNICSNESSFEVSVNGTPNVDTLADQTACGSYILPTLTDGNYFTGTNGTGTPLNAGDSVSTIQTIYIYVEIGTAPDTCTNESSFEVTITSAPDVDTISNQAVCSDYTLPSLTNGNYFTGTNGTGTPLNAGDIISTDQTIYIYNEIGTAPNICSNESSFEVTVNGTPNVDTLSDQTECASYTLPTLTNGNYFSGTNGTGTPLNAGDVISSSQTIYIYVEIGTAPDTCNNESSFDVTITGAPNVDTLANQTICSEYTLPTLTNGNYFTGTNGTGTLFNAGDVITTSQTLYIYSEIGTAPNTCSNESSFDITINDAVDFTLDESNISISNSMLIVTMTDLTSDYLYAVDYSSTQTSNIFNDLSEGIHTLHVSDIYGCIIKSLSFEIEVDLFIPVFFTPNNDTYNDYWTVIDRNYIVKEILIFNRYGKLIKQLIPLNYSWDGYYNGKMLESNDFWYLITLKNGDELRGHFALKH